MRLVKDILFIAKFLVESMRVPLALSSPPSSYQIYFIVENMKVLQMDKMLFWCCSLNMNMPMEK